jgi:hypothetical protein
MGDLVRTDRGTQLASGVGSLNQTANVDPWEYFHALRETGEVVGRADGCMARDLVRGLQGDGPA